MDQETQPSVVKKNPKRIAAGIKSAAIRKAKREAIVQVTKDEGMVQVEKYDSKNEPINMFIKEYKETMIYSGIAAAILGGLFMINKQTSPVKADIPPSQVHKPEVIDPFIFN